MDQYISLEQSPSILKQAVIDELNDSTFSPKLLYVKSNTLFITACIDSRGLFILHRFFQDTGKLEAVQILEKDIIDILAHSHNLSERTDKLRAGTGGDRRREVK